MPFKKAKSKNGERKRLKSLPGSDDKDFWGEDADILNFDIDKDAEHYKLNSGHQWRQQGPYLICNSCPLKHAVRIGVGKHLIGFTKKGKPILKELNI